MTARGQGHHFYDSTSDYTFTTAPQALFNMKTSLVWHLILLSCISPALTAPTTSMQQSVTRPAINVPCKSSGASSTCGLALDTTLTSVVSMTTGSLTLSQTFHGTSLSGYENLTAATTLTTTDSAGETVVAVVLAAAAAGGAAGIAWLAAVPKPLPGVPDVPTVGPPNVPPSITPTLTFTTLHTSAATTSRAPSSTIVTSEVPDPIQSVFAHSELAIELAELIKTPPPPRMPSDSLFCFAPGTVAAVGDDYGRAKIKEFCDSHKGRTATGNGKGTIEVWNSAPGQVLNLTVAQTPDCAARHDTLDSVIDFGDCNTILPEILDRCPRLFNRQSGGILSDGCLEWSLKPSLSEGVLSCDVARPKSGDKLEGTGANRGEAIDNVKDFCKTNAGKSVSKGGTGFWGDYRPRLGNSYMTFGLDYSKDPECTGEGDSYKLDEPTCTRLLSKTVDGCDTNFKGDTGKFGGQVLDGCGQLRMSTTVSEVFTCGFNFYPNPAKSVSADLLKDAINDYCSQDLYMYPDYSPRKFTQSSPKDLANWQYTRGNTKIYMSTYVSSEVQDQKFPGNKCAAPAKFSIKGDDCRRKMMVAANQCLPGNSAGYLNDNSANGCIMWQWSAVNV